MNDEIQKGLDKFHENIIQKTKEVSGDTEIQSALEELRKTIQVIKEDPTKYREKHPEILSLEQTILARIGIAKKEMQERVDIAKKAFLYFGQIENFIQKLPTEIQQIPAIRDRITGVRKLMDDCRSNPLLYKTKITEFSQFQEFINENKVIYEELLEEEAFLKKMADISFNSDSTSQDNAKKLLERVKALKQGMGGRTRDADIDEFQLDTQNIKIEYSKRALVAGREKWKSDNIDTVKISLRDKLKDATERKDFAKSLGIENDDIQSISDACIKMMLESDGLLSISDILTFYTKAKKAPIKRASEADISSWISQIESQDTTGKVEGAKVSGLIPKDMQEAIMKELAGPNTLKMMQTASRIYEAELNDYLKGVDNKRPIKELGFTDNDPFWKLFKDEAGAELDLSDQEAKLVFLEAYTSTLALVIKDPSKIPEIVKDGEGLGWWWLAIIFGTLLSPIILSRLLVGGALTEKWVTASVKGIVSGGKWILSGGKWILSGGKWVLGKPFLGIVRGSVEVLKRNKSNYEVMMNPDGGRLSPNTRRFILSQIQLIHARMNLPDKGKLEFEGDTYDKLSRSEGEKRIAAIEAAVGSAKQDFTSEEERKAAAKKDPSGVKGKFDRFGFIQMDPSNTQKSNDCLLNKELIAYIQGLSRSPNTSFFWRPNTRFLEQNLWNHAISVGIRLAEVGVPATAGYFAGGPLLAIPAGLLGSPGFRRTFIGGDIMRLRSGTQSGFFLDKPGGERITRLSSLQESQKMADRIGEEIRTSKEINLLTCSIEDIQAGVDFLEQFFNESSESSSSNPTIYSEREVLDRIKKILLTQKGHRMTRLELRLHILRSVYLLRDDKGTILKDAVDKFLIQMQGNRYSHNSIDYVDTIYERIVKNKDAKIPKHQKALLNKQIEAIFQGHGVQTHSLENNSNTTETLFGTLDPLAGRFTDVEMDVFMNRCLLWMRQQNDARERSNRVTEEEFAEYILTELNNDGRSIPLNYALLNRYHDLWRQDVLRTSGLDPLLDKISSGDVATYDELQTEFQRLIGKIDRSKFTPEEEEAFQIAIEEFDKFVVAQKGKFDLNGLFESATDKKNAQGQLNTILQNKAMRCVGLSQFGDRLYHIVRGQREVNAAFLDTEFEARWNTWIRAKIDRMKTEFAADPLNQANVTSYEHLMNQCDPKQQEELSRHFRDELMKKASENDEAKVPRAKRTKALEMLKSKLVSGLQTETDKDTLTAFITAQEAAIVAQDAKKTQDKLDADMALEKTKIAAEIAQLKTDITADALDDGVESRFPETLKKCDPVQRAELIDHFSKALQAIASDTSRSKKDREEAMSLLEKEIVPHLTRTPRNDLRKYISTTEESIHQAEISAEITQLKTDITTDPLDDKVESRFVAIMAQCSDAQKGELARHFQKELETIASESVQSKKKTRLEAVTLLETLVKKHFAGRSEREALDTFTERQRADMDKLDGLQEKDALTRAVEKIKRDITTDALHDDLEQEFPEILLKCDRPQKLELLRHFRDALISVAKDITIKTDLRKEAIDLLKTQIKSGLPRTERADLDTFIAAQEAAIVALENMLLRRQENAQKLVTTLGTLFQGQDTVEKRKIALESLLEGDSLTTGQKNIIRKFFPEDGSGEVSQESVDDCVHALIYLSQEIPGNELAKAHKVLRENMTALIPLNAELRALGITEIGENISDTVTARAGKK